MTKVTVRRWEVWGAFLLLAASAAAMGFFLQRSNSATARATAANHRLIASNRRAIRSINRFRFQRVRETSRTDLILCRAANEVRKINNRDRNTLLRAARSSAAAHRAATAVERAVADDPGALILARYLDDLLSSSIRSSQVEVDVRPRLPLVKCRQLPSVASTGTKALSGPKPKKH